MACDLVPRRISLSLLTIIVLLLNTISVSANSLTVEMNRYPSNYNTGESIAIFGWATPNASVSINSFSNQVINYAGVSALPMFEDCSRFFAILISSNVPGSKIFSSYWSKVRSDLFKKIVSKGMTFLARS